jgi:hypothetical protein
MPPAGVSVPTATALPPHTFAVAVSARSTSVAVHPNTCDSLRFDNHAAMCMQAAAGDSCTVVLTATGEALSCGRGACCGRGAACCTAADPQIDVPMVARLDALTAADIVVVEVPAARDRAFASCCSLKPHSLLFIQAVYQF